MVDPLVTDVVLSFFITGQLLKVLNNTSISLIPKASVPSTKKDFLPIS